MASIAMDAAPRLVSELAALTVFAFVGSVSPGPNNALLWASGISFGFRRTLPHVVGTAIGIGVLVVAVAAGVGALLDEVPGAEVALKVVGSVYLLFLAFLVAGSGAVGKAAVSRPLGWWQAVAFQLVNPKAWVFAVAAVGTFLPRDLPWVIGVALLVGILGVVVACSSAIWAAGGVALGRVVEDERRRRIVSVVLAALIVVSVVFLWI